MTKQVLNKVNSSLGFPFTGKAGLQLGNSTLLTTGQETAHPYELAVQVRQSKSHTFSSASVNTKDAANYF